MYKHRKVDVCLSLTIHPFVHFCFLVSNKCFGWVTRLSKIMQHFLSGIILTSQCMSQRYQSKDDVQVSYLTAGWVKLVMRCCFVWLVFVVAQGLSFFSTKSNHGNKISGTDSFPEYEVIKFQKLFRSTYFTNLVGIIKNSENKTNSN